MFIEQIIEFELRVPKPLVVQVFLKLVIFITKTKISEAKLSNEILFNAKHIAQGNVSCFPYLGQVTYKI